MVVLSLSEANGSTLASRGFPWLPLVAAHIRKRLARALHISGVYWFYKTILIPSSQLRPSYPPTHFKLRRRQFLIKITFAITISKVQ